MKEQQFAARESIFTGNAIFREITQKQEELQDLDYALGELDNHNEGIAYRTIERERDRVSNELQALRNKRYVIKD